MIKASSTFSPLRQMEEVKTLMEILLQEKLSPAHDVNVSKFSFAKWQIMHFDIRSVNIWWGRRWRAGKRGCAGKSKVIKKLPTSQTFPHCYCMPESGNNKRKETDTKKRILSLWLFSILLVPSRRVTIWTRRFKSQNSLVHSVRKMRKQTRWKTVAKFCAPLNLQFGGEKSTTTK